MNEPQQEEAQGGGAAMEMSEFGSLLKQEFKPKSDKAKQAVEKPSKPPTKN